jgi:hypothetical protein
MEDFRFKIGDLVVHKDALALWEGGFREDWEQQKKEKREYRLIRINPPTAFRVLERLTQECYGGTQRFYDCRGVRDYGPEARAKDNTPIRFTEIEVVEYPAEFLRRA